MTRDPFNVLFLCTGNSARSILAEAILREEGDGRFRAFSAGSHPKGAVNPLAPKVLESFGYPADHMRSKSWEEFETSGAPVMDFVFTVRDQAAGEVCPIRPGQPMTAHWGIDDPAAAEGTDIQKEAAFVTAFRHLKNRIMLFVASPLSGIDKMALGTKSREIGRMDGSTFGRPEAG
jgi:arsenate reductase